MWACCAASGRKAVESHLHHCTAEFLNADIAQRIVTSVSQAHAWLQKSLFWVRVFQNPPNYGFTAPAMPPDAIAQQAMHLFVDTPLRKLQESGIIEINGADGTITPKDPSSLMCKHCIQLATMIMINEAPSAASPRDLLEVRPVPSWCPPSACPCYSVLFDALCAVMPHQGVLLTLCTCVEMCRSYARLQRMQT